MKTHETNEKTTGAKDFSARAAAICAVLLAAAIFVGASASLGSSPEPSGSDDGRERTRLAYRQDEARNGASSEKNATKPAPETQTYTDTATRTGDAPDKKTLVALKARALADANAEDVANTNNAASAEQISADGGAFPVTYADDGTLLCDAASLARLAGATSVTLADGSLRATGGGIDLFVGADDEYVLSAGRAFWTGRLPSVTDDGAFVPLAPIAAALGFTVWDDGEGGASLSGGGAIESADTRYDAGELYWLSRIIYAESGCEPMTGKIAVGNVVLNRVRSESYPDTVYGVIFDRRFGTVQFTPTASGTIYLEPSEDAVIAAKICLEGFSLSDEIEFFFNPEIAESSWISDNRPWIMTIAHHAFYG